MFPRYLLCRHFWTESQKIEFAQSDLVKHRIPHTEKVLQYMYQHSSKIRDSGLQKHFTDVLSQVCNKIYKMHMYVPTVYIIESHACMCM